MKNNKLFIVSSLISILTLTSFTFLKSDLGKITNCKDCIDLIWNQGITKRSWVYLYQDEGKYYKRNSDISEGDALKMPKNYWSASYIDADTQQKFGTANKTNASFKLVTLGYKVEDQKKTEGFDFIVLNNDKKNDEPFIFRIINNSQSENNLTLGTLREVGFVLDNWPQYWPKENTWTGGEHSFSGNYNIQDFDQIIVKFKYRLIDFKAPLNKKKINEKWLGSYVTCDFRFNQYDETGKVIDKSLIGVVFSNPLGVDYNGNPNDGILYGDKTTRKNGQQMILLHGNENGVKEINTINSENEFQTVEINFKPLINKYLEYNKNNRNIITGLDIYSATRAADLTYDIQDVQVTGCKNK